MSSFDYTVEKTYKYKIYLQSLKQLLFVPQHRSTNKNIFLCAPLTNNRKYIKNWKIFLCYSAEVSHIESVFDSTNTFYACSALHQGIET